MNSQKILIAVGVFGFFALLLLKLPYKLESPSGSTSKPVAPPTAFATAAPAVPTQHRLNVSFLLVSTGEYVAHLPNLIESFDKHWLPHAHRDPARSINGTSKLFPTPLASSNSLPLTVRFNWFVFSDSPEASKFAKSRSPTQSSVTVFPLEGLDKNLAAAVSENQHPLFARSSTFLKHADAWTGTQNNNPLVITSQLAIVLDPHIVALQLDDGLHLRRWLETDIVYVPSFSQHLETNTNSAGFLRQAEAAVVSPLAWPGFWGGPVQSVLMVLRRMQRFYEVDATASPPAPALLADEAYLQRALVELTPPLRLHALPADFLLKSQSVTLGDSRLAVSTSLSPLRVMTIPETKVECNDDFQHDPNGKDITGPSVDMDTRSCLMRGICWDTARKHWAIYDPANKYANLRAKIAKEHAARQGAPHPGPGLLLRGSLRDDYSIWNPTWLNEPLPINQVRLWVENPTILLGRHYPGNFAHIMADDVFAAFWAMRRYFPGDSPQGLKPRDQYVIVIDDPWGDHPPSVNLLKKYLSDTVYHQDEALTAAGPVPPSAQSRTLVCYRQLGVGVPAQTMQRNEGYNHGDRRFNNPLDLAGYIPTNHAFADLLGSTNGLPPRVQYDQTKHGLRIIFINRKGRRIVMNGDDVVRALSNHFGMEVPTVYLEDLPLEKQASTLREASIVVAMHGAGLINTVYMNAGTGIVEGVPEGARDVTGFFQWTSRHLGLHHETVYVPGGGLHDNTIMHVDQIIGAVNRLGEKMKVNWPKKASS